MKGKTRVRIWGDLDLTAIDGADLCPTGVKERAILALLLVAPGHKRARRWLQAMLWADATPEAGATNLRQSIARLKRALAPADGLLHVDRMSVWLDPQAFEIQPRSNAGDMLFEGLDVGEETFEDWLLETRQWMEDTPTTPQSLHTIAPAKEPDRRPILTLRAGRGLVPDDGEVHRIVATLRNRLLCFELIDLREAMSPAPITKGLVMQVERMAPDVTAITLIDAAEGRMLWSQNAPATDVDQISAANLIEGALEALLSMTEPDASGEAAHLAGLLDMGRVFEGLFTPGVMSVEDMLLAVERGLETGPNALLFALRNCIRMLQYGERREGHGDIRHDVVADDLNASLTHGPSNALVHGLASHTHYLFLGDKEQAIEHGQIALAAAPHSAICTALVGLAHLRADRVEPAKDLAGRAVKLGRMSRYRPFLDGTYAAVLASANDFVGARQYAERTLARAPAFSAIRKVLFLAEEKLGMAENALATAELIRKAEPEFGARSIVSDTPSVSVSILRHPMAESARRLGLD